MELIQFANLLPGLFKFHCLSVNNCNKECNKWLEGREKVKHESNILRNNIIIIIKKDNQAAQ